MQATPTVGLMTTGDLPRPTAGADHRRAVLDMLELHAQQHPLNPALSVLERGRWRRLSYLALAQRVRELAAWLVRRLPEGGQSVAVLGESNPAWGVVALGTVASGNVLVPLDPGAGRGALADMLGMVRPALLFVSARHADLAREVANGICDLVIIEDPLLEAVLPEPDAGAARSAGGIEPAPDTALMVFTSGTTGTPKLVEIGFDNLHFQIRSLTRSFALRPSDRLLSMLPLHHMLELTAGFLCPLWRGAQIHYLGSLLPGEALAEMRALGITRVVTVPAWLALLARELRHRAPDRGAARDAFGPDFEHFVCGGAALPAALERYFSDLGAPVMQGYGLTETAPVIATNTLGERRDGSVGRPLPGTEVRVEASGEILIRGPQVASRYHLGADERADVADDERWFHTGDLGHLDAQGFLHVTGRAKSTIVLANGKNVQPEEIEACLDECDELAESGVVGLSGERAGESVCAVVVPAESFRSRPGAAGGDPARGVRRVIDQALAPLAAYKRPRRVLVSDTPLPRTTTGKLCRPALRALAERLAEDAS
ncbi:MAG: class I adenylate-forming enzyme family protein [Gammaproteobacteria bacterium]|nr:class I adenylate-forming enzyme family protein [Gammaproteobacteria bacterium]